MNLGTWLKVVGTFLVMSALLYTVSTKELFITLSTVPATNLICVLVVMPLYIYCRFKKWMSLVSQVTEIGKIQVKDCFFNYLNGMALGMLTPGRVGELARIRGLNINKRSAISLFMLDKLIEVWCLVFFVAVAFSVTNSLSAYISRSYLIALLPVLALLLFAFHKIVMTIAKKHIVIILNVSKNVILSSLCFVIFCLQMTIVLQGFNTSLSLLVFFHFPVVLIGNLIPVTIGGFGVREFIGIYALQHYAVSRESIVASIAIVAFIDLVIPSIIGMMYTAGHLNFIHKEGSTDESQR